MNLARVAALLRELADEFDSANDEAAPPAPKSRPRARSVRRRRLPVVPATTSVSDSDRAAARRALAGAGILESKR